ncbi:hypothetical protein R3W88_025939 [Solanum pinnatisectum]|uniref:Uncharacterized protein n=1 Tax=Solanum pinnatisectum TaxID=50273 RepID=A0AAV9M4T2_9SOLN|nr:hypothetical protein R3W88_025939 [Solanum pinnatisectum]
MGLNWDEIFISKFELIERWNCNGKERRVVRFLGEGRRRCKIGTPGKFDNGPCTEMVRDSGHVLRWVLDSRVKKKHARRCKIGTPGKFDNGPCTEMVRDSGHVLRWVLDSRVKKKHAQGL